MRVLNVAINPPERRKEGLEKLVNILVYKNEGETLSSLSLGTLVCTNCAKREETIHCLREAYFLVQNFYRRSPDTIEGPHEH